MPAKKIICLVFASFFLLLTTFVVNDFIVSSKSFSADEFSQTAKPAPDDLGEMSVKVASLLGDGQFARKSESEKSSAVELIAARYERLLLAAEENPSEVLRAALPAEILAKAPDEFGAFLEKPLETEGALEVVYECDENSAVIKYFLKTAENERLELHFVEDPSRELMTETTARVKGVRIGDKVVLKAENLDAPNSLAVLPNTFGEHKVLVLLVNFQNDTRQPFTAAQINDLVFGSVNNFYRENSYGQTWLAGDVRGYFTLPINTGDCDGTTTAYYAKQAAQNAGINLSAYNKFIYFYPTMSACGYGGRGTIGGSEAWINGYYSLRTFAHELGHNFGLNHARAMDCHPATIGSNCSTVEYGNTVDMMGLPGVTGHFHAFQKERLGWLNFGASPSVTTVQTGGTYTIAPYSPLDFAPKALKIFKSSGTWYYVEFRRPIGFDSFISGNANLMNGVLVTMNKETGGAENYLLDMTPETTSWNDPALTVNRSFTDAGAGVTITPVSVGEGGATVNVTFGAAACSQANPSLSFAPTATQWIGAGGSVSYSLTVMNNNSSNCGNARFNLQTSLPSGWTATAPSALNLASGASATTTVQISVPSSAANGFYAIGFTASNTAAPNYSAAATANSAVYSSLGVAASPGQASYTRSQTAVITATVSANGSPMAGANVAFTLTKSDGSRVTATAVSDANGAATFSYRFNKKRDPAGIYQVSVAANLNGISGSGSTSFQVR